ncbi:ABC transporter ATP-binding protein [Candidatus Desantisbacteria bacterium CG23_combo_of_CG06-09_8_20_14_all_40_23]|uniref:ABC transporter ATP-binding protein n=1 Tax=Candidatus Desantisbacteria bacterium CG23_combo_of_CG06-09_8_20_14_all_40_23 TaxID=1974550 RepID=A0A2H0A9S2_9BACT|nr:MAG: ABC transporter ATP-binding protein [Candidatus Desantisbacteria bacterium CG23_combo_of_CG06-09_8_20_14_all_40_23]
MHLLWLHRWLAFDKGIFMTTISRLLKYVLGYKLLLFIAICCILIVSGCSLTFPWLIKGLLEDALNKRDLFQLNIILGIALMVAIIQAVSQYTHSFIMNYIGQRVLFVLRNQIFEHLTHLSMKFHKDSRCGELISRTINDVNVLQNLIISGAAVLIKSPFILIGGICIIFYIHWKLALLTMVIAPLIAVAIVQIGKRMRQITHQIQEKMADVTNILQETISGIAIVKLFCAEGIESKRFFEENKGYFHLYLKGIKLMVISGPLVWLIGIAGMLLVVWYGGYEVSHERLTAGALMSFMAYLLTVSRPIQDFSQANILIQQAIAASQRIFELLDTRLTVEEAIDAEEMSDVKGTEGIKEREGERETEGNIEGREGRISRGRIEFEGVSFVYDDKPVLCGINLTIEPGEVLALVGPSGGGKTTLVSLIPRLYDPTVGTIKIDERDIRGVTLKSLRRQIGIVPQHTILFSGSIASNIAYSQPDASMEEIIEAAMTANAHNFITHLPSGYDTPIGEHGVRLSGGERQRIAIARALLKKPGILILDEATASLDTESENLIQSALFRIMHQQTTIIIAHRLSTIIRADRIVTISEGNIVEIGTHDELLSSGGLYKRLYEVQFEAIG